jgi:hypothetical protein
VFFGVTADELLCINKLKEQEEIDGYNKRRADALSLGHTKEAIAIMREANEKYPGNYRIMYELAYAIRIDLYSVHELEYQLNAQKEIISIGEKILAECTDDFIRHEAIRWLCDIYSYSDNADEKEKAEKLAKKMPHSWASSDALLTGIYTGDKKYRMIRQNIHHSIRYLYDNMKFIIHYPLDNGHNPYTPEERIILHKKFIEIINIIFDDGNYGYFSNILETSYRDIAIYSMQIGDCVNAVENLKMASEYAIKRDEEHNPEQEYTSLFFKGMKISEIKHLPSSPNNYSKDFLEFIQNSGDFEPIRHKAEFIEIEENLKKHAKVR